MTLLSLKPGVQTKGLTSRALLCIMVAECIYRELGYSLTVTSALDGVHGHPSFHYQGDAVDLRTHNVRDTDKPTLVRMLKQALQGFDVIFEHAGEPAEHIHCEPANESPVS